MDYQEQYQNYLAQAMAALKRPAAVFCRKNPRCAVQHATA